MAGVKPATFAGVWTLKTPSIGSGPDSLGAKHLQVVRPLFVPGKPHPPVRRRGDGTGGSDGLGYGPKTA